MAMGPRRSLVDRRFAPQPSALRHIDKHSNRYRDSWASRDVRAYTDINRVANAVKMKASNKGVQGTRHKVSGPLTPDVRQKDEN